MVSVLERVDCISHCMTTKTKTMIKISLRSNRTVTNAITSMKKIISMAGVQQKLKESSYIRNELELFGR